MSEGAIAIIMADAVKIVPNTAEDALYVHADHLGTPQKMTDASAAIVWDATLRPFGEEDGVTGTATNNNRFPGQYKDAESALHYNYFRDYDPTIGRYPQSDPIGLGGGLNTYAYVGGNPVVNFDPTGQFVPAAVIVCAANPACAVLFVGTCYAVIQYAKQTIRVPVNGGRACKECNNANQNEAAEEPQMGEKPGLTSGDQAQNPYKGKPGSSSQTTNPDGSPKQTRHYSDDGYPKTDIDYNHDHGQGTPHAHDWSRPNDGGPPTHKNRGRGRPLVPGEK